MSVEGTLYHNDSGSFTSFTGGLGAGIWGDYDNDGYQDYFSYESSQLRRNDEGTGFPNTSSVLPNLPTPRAHQAADLVISTATVSSIFTSETMRILELQTIRTAYFSATAALHFRSPGSSRLHAWHAVSRRQTLTKTETSIFTSPIIAWNRTIFGKTTARETLPIQPAPAAWQGRDIRSARRSATLTMMVISIYSKVIFRTPVIPVRSF